MSNRYSLCIYARTLEGKIGLILGVSVVLLTRNSHGVSYSNHVYSYQQYWHRIKEANAEALYTSGLFPNPTKKFDLLMKHYWITHIKYTCVEAQVIVVSDEKYFPPVNLIFKRICLSLRHPEPEN